MTALPEFVGTIHIYLGPYRGNPIALYLRQDSNACCISPSVYPWSQIVGTGETVNKAAADFDEKWKQGGLSLDMYSGPHWEGGIKPEKPKPPPKPAPPAKTEAASDSPPSTPPKTEEDTPSSEKPQSDQPTPTSTTEPN